MNQEEGRTTSEVYPVSAGHRHIEASMIAAAQVDRDPMRKLNTMTAICIETIVKGGKCADDIAVLISESFRYVQPRCSELCAMGILKRGAMKKSPLHGRSAHVLEPSLDLEMGLRKLVERSSYDLDDIRFLVRSMIVQRQARIAQEKRDEKARAA